MENKWNFSSDRNKVQAIKQAQTHLRAIVDAVVAARTTELNFAPNETCSVEDYDKILKAVRCLDTVVSNVYRDLPGALNEA